MLYCGGLFFFYCYPFKIKSQLDDKKIYPGTEPGAPSNPRILKKGILYNNNNKHFVYYYIYFIIF